MRRRAVCFDATGTLIETSEPVGAVYRRVAMQFDVTLPSWRLEDAFRRVLRHAPPRGTDGATREAREQAERDWWFERIRQTFQATDSTVRFADFPAFATALFETYRSPQAWRTRPGVSHVLHRLHARSVPMAVVSNFDHRLPEILQHLGILNLFDHIEMPSQGGHRKPDEAVFVAAAQALGRTPGELVYVGDDPPEVLRAIAAHGVVVIEVTGEDSREPGWLRALEASLADAARGDAEDAGAATLRQD